MSRVNRWWRRAFAEAVRVGSNGPLFARRLEWAAQYGEDRESAVALLSDNPAWSVDGDDRTYPRPRRPSPDGRPLALLASVERDLGGEP